MSKKRISEAEASAARERLSTSTNMDDLGDADFVIEAVPVCVSPGFSSTSILSIDSSDYLSRKSPT